MIEGIDRSEGMDRRDGVDRERIDRCAYQLDVGAFMMGGLGAEEHTNFAVHLVDCDRCNGEISELLPVLALLDSGRVSSVRRAEEAPSSSLRQHVVAAVGRAGNDAVLASVRELRPGSSSTPVIGSSTSGSSTPGSSDSLAAASIATTAVATGAAGAVDGQNPGSVSELVRPKRFDRRFLAVAAAAVLAIGVTVTTVRKTGTPGTSYQLVALQKDPLRASAKIHTKSETTVAEFVVNGTIPDEIYFAWFEDPEGKRIGLGSFRGAAGPVKFRGQTGIPRAKIVAVGASTRAGDKPTDRIRAELPNGQ
jgi:hypothetical protein